MKARVESIGGTTLEIMIPLTAAISRPTGENKFRRRIPHSSAVCSWTVRRRHWHRSLRPSNAPMVILLLPASRASSTYASCNNQSIGSIVFSDDEVALGIETLRGSLDDAVRDVHADAP